MAKKRKTELDLDETVVPEAEPEAPPAEEAPEPTEETVEAEPETKPKVSKKNLYIIGGLVGAVVILGIIASFLVFSGEEAPVQEEEAVTVEEEEPEPEPEIPTVEPLFNIVLEPFTVPYEEKGKKQIMFVQFSLNLSNKDAVSEIEENIVVMREAIYIYISRREKADFAIDKKRAEILDDLKNLLDRSLLNGRVQDVLITQLNFF